MNITKKFLVLIIIISVLTGFVISDFFGGQKVFDHRNHDHAAYEIPEGEPIPAVTNLKVEKDAVSGWNISFETQNFVFTPENVNRNHVIGEGHAHLHVDGVKVSRLYASNYHLDGLGTGVHTISVYLNTNQHEEYVVNGAGTGMEVVVKEG